MDLREFSLEMLHFIMTSKYFFIASFWKSENYATFGSLHHNKQEIYTGCIDRIRALFGSLWYKDVRFYKNYNFFCKRVSLYASIHLWVCDDKAIFSWDMDDFVHGVSSKVRPIGVQIEQKRLCTLCSKCYHGTHNDPRLLKFSTHILLLDSFAIKKF